MRVLISHFIAGGSMVGFLAIGFFFFRFWRKTHDSLFAVFAASFLVLAIERIVLLLTAGGVGPDSVLHEQKPYVYLIRFFAFMLIIAAFLMKNRRAE